MEAWSCLISVLAFRARACSSFSSFVLKWPGGKRRSWAESPLAWLSECAATGVWWERSVG